MQPGNVKWTSIINIMTLKVDLTKNIFAGEKKITKLFRNFFREMPMPTTEWNIIAKWKCYLNVKNVLLGWVLEWLNGVWGPPVLLPLRRLRQGLRFHICCWLIWWVDHARWMGEGTMQRPPAIQEVTRSIGDPLLQTNIVVSEALRADLVLFRDLNARLF